jgi:group I intron endonuclease
MKQPISGIYCIECLINNKKYIGKSKNIKKRLSKHQTMLKKNTHENKHLQSAYNKYGKENFSFYILEECEESEVSEKEKYYIKIFKTKDREFGYNCTDGGEEGFTFSDETKKRMSDNHANFSGENHPFWGQHHTDDAKEQMRLLKMGENNPNYGKPMSKERKEKISISNKGKHSNDTEETRKKKRESHLGEKNYWFGKHLPLETRKKMSEAQTGEKNHAYGKRMPDEQKEKISISNLGKKRPDASSLFYGVSILVANKKDIYWEAGIYINGKRKYIGNYKKELDAAIAYDEYIIEHDLPRPLNFPENYPKRNIE